MSDSVDNGERPVTTADLAALRSAFDGLADGLRELREASTASERREAQADVRDAREDLDELAGRLGISRKTLDASIAEARRAERKDELRPIIAELLAEAKTEEPEPEPKPKPKKAQPKAEEPKSDEPVPDLEPMRPHWSEQTVGNLLRS
jgi:hypothetical protein